MNPFSIMVGIDKILPNLDMDNGDEILLLFNC